MLPNPPYREKDLTGQPWQKWFAAVAQIINRFYTSNNVVIDSDINGLVLKDTAGHYWRINVSTLGVLTTTDLGTSKP